MRKGVQLEPLIYAGILAILLAYRLLAYVRKQGRKSRSARTQAA
jgi:DMSO/TMAO reductase YedYZ heme-binding membrane subunit